MKSILAFTATLGVVAMIFAQGPLTPPGAPAPTMKTLAQIESRTAIMNVPYTITSSGSYYLTTNFFSATHGIIIRAGRVTLDLMGFSLTGDRGSSDYGIFLDGATNGALNDITVRGGSIGGFGRGVLCEYVQNSRMEKLMISSNLYGIYLHGVSGLCDGNTITDCDISENGNGNGIYLRGSSGQCNGNRIVGCVISGHNGSGIWLDGGSSGRCNGNTLAGCTIADNGLSSTYGVLFYGNSGQCNGNTVADCTISGSGSYGIHLDGASGQCNGNMLVRCVLRKNTEYGISLGSGADGNRIENNHVSGTFALASEGIHSEGSKNIFLQNTCVGQIYNFGINANDTYGPIVTNSGSLSTNGAAAHPWANFSR